MRPLKQRLTPLWLRQTREPVLPGALADQYAYRIYITLREPLCIPGAVLSPGDYVFRLLDWGANRSLVQVFNEDQTTLVAAFTTAADH